MARLRRRRRRRSRYGETLAIGGVDVTFHPAGHVLGSAQIAVEANGTRMVASGDYKDVADPTCAPFEPVRCDAFITEATFGLPVFRHGDPRAEIAKLLHSVALFPERAHLVGAYSLGKAQRVIALIRAPATTSRSTCTARWRASRATTRARHRSRRSACHGAARCEAPSSPARSRSCPPSALQDRWTRRFPDPVLGLRVGLDARARPRAASAASSCRWWFLRSCRLGRAHRDHRGDRRVEIWVTHGAEEALVHW